MDRIKAPRLSTTEEMTQVATRWWEDHKGINFLDYNDRMVKNTLPFHTIKVSPEKIKKLLKATDFGKLAVDGVIAEIGKEVDLQFREIPCKNDFFFKLITRSPKDEIKINRFSSLSDALFVMACSMRCFDDLVLLHYIDKCILVIRPYYEIPKNEEWRIFVKDGVISGISQYHYFDSYKYDNIDDIEQRIRSYIEKEVVPNMAVDAYCVDLWVKKEGIIVIETNPYYLSDPCLFLDHDNLDRSIKWKP